MLIEAMVINHLNTMLSVNAYGEVPDKPPKSFVIVEKTNEGKTNLIRNCTLTIMSYADTMHNAATLNESVQEAMEEFVGNDKIASCRLSSGGIYTNTAMKKYRFRSVFNIAFY